MPSQDPVATGQGPTENAYRRHVLTVMAAAVLALLAADLLLRAAGTSYPSFNIPDEHTGWALRPGVEGWSRREGSTYVCINSDGLRDREHEISKPVGTFRIAVVGDSFAAAMQVPLEEAFWSVMALNLRSCGALAGNKVEVINFGVPGYGTAQELMALRHRVWKYDPDLVLLAFFPVNDVRNNSRSLQKDPLRPYFDLGDDGLEADMSFRETPGYNGRNSLLWRIGLRLSDHSRLLQLVNQVTDETRRRALGTQRSKGECGLTEYNDSIYKESPDAVWESAWRATEAIIGRMWMEASDEGASFRLLVVTGGIEVDPDPTERDELAGCLGAEDLLYPKRRVEALGEKLGFPVLSLAEPFQEYAVRTGTLLHGFDGQTSRGHWNRDGHGLAGELTAAWLCESLVSVP